MPPQASGVLATRDELAAFRSRALDPAPDAGGASAPGEGLIAANATDLLRYVLLDGVPIAWVPAGKETYVIGPQRGRYSVQWRTFLGDSVEPARTVELPARIVAGQADAPAPIAPARDR